MSIDNGGPAFPQYKTHCIPGGGVRAEIGGGITIRDYFAAKAAQGIMANQECYPASQAYFDNIAADAYRIADAMLKARGES